MINKKLFGRSKNEKVIDVIQPKNGIRFASATVDFIFFIMILIILLVFGGNGFVNMITPYNQNLQSLNQYVYSSALGTFKDNKFVRIEDTENSIDNTLKHLEYYYLNWKVGEYNDFINDTDYKKVENPSPINYEIKIGDEMKDYRYYWFNVNVLNLDDEYNLYNVKTERNDYFIYDETNLNKIANKNPKYFKDDGTIIDIHKEKIKNFVENLYSKATIDLSNESFYHEIVKKNMSAEKIESLVFTIVPVLLIYIIPGLIFTERKTFGRLIFKIGLVNKSGKELSSLSYLLRFVPLTVIILFNYFLNSLYLFGIIAGLLFIINLSMVLFSINKRGVFEFISNSCYIDDREVIWQNEKSE